MNRPELLEGSPIQSNFDLASQHQEAASQSNIYRIAWQPQIALNTGADSRHRYWHSLLLAERTGLSVVRHDFRSAQESAVERPGQTFRLQRRG